MLKNLFTTALRNLFKNKLISAINIFGLSAGVSAFLLLFLYIYHEETYDHFHDNKDQIYRLMENDMVFTRGLTAPTLLETFPEIKNATRFLDWAEHRIEYQDVSIRQTTHYVDTSFFNMFSFQFIEGNPDNALNNKYSVVLTKPFAERLFGQESALNKTISVDFDKHQLTVTGVVAPIPENSSINFSVITSYATGVELDPWLEMVHDWYNTFSQSYVMLDQHTHIESLESKFIPFVNEHFITGESTKPTLKLLPLTELHGFTSENQSFTYILICIAAGIAVIAIFNFINLYSAASSGRIKEVGMRKTMGASYQHLLGLFYGESLLISFFAVIGGVLLTVLILPKYNQLFDTGLKLNLMENPWLWPIIFMLWILAGTLSGLIPAVRLSKVHTIASLKGKFSTSHSKMRFGPGMAVFQFAIAIFLIIGTIVIKKQITFMQDHALNLDAEQIVVVESQFEEYPDQEAASQKIKSIINALKNDSRIASVTTSSKVPGNYIENYNLFYPNGWSTLESIRLRKVDIGDDYFKTYGIKWLEGEQSRQSFLNDSNAVVINQTALNELGVHSAVGQILYENSKDGRPYKIVGVVDDYFYQGVHREIQPMIHYYQSYIEENPPYVSIRFRQGNLKATLEMLQEKWVSIPPVKPLNYFFVEDEINKQYAFVKQTSSLATYFSVLSVILCSLGLLAMTLFLINRRIKEIGLRKVVGASVFNIVGMLNFQYLKWIGVSVLLAVPLGYYAMNKWLQEFAHQTQLNWWVFGLAGLITLLIALLTVSFQTVKAAISNPVDALRYE
ncbi:MAG: ABC transporter permease [Candidatus Cyclobacteriaceae bacterium M3_2C_046]